jgi:protease secretion system outer membrane protein
MKMVKKNLALTRIAGALLGLALTGATLPVAAHGLLEGWQSALTADPQYRSARFERDAGRLSVPLARAALLPNVALQTSDSKVNGDRTSLIPGVTDATTSPLAYTSQSRALNMRVPVYYKEGWERLRQGEAQAEYANALFEVRAKDLAQRLGQAYFELLLGLETIELTQAQVQTYREQINFATRRFAGGEGTRTEIFEATARLDLAEAQLIDAKDQVDIARRTLSNITGRDASSVTMLRQAPATIALMPASLNEWLELSRRDSPELRTKRYAIEAAQADVARSRAGHMPRVDLIASISRTKNDTVNTLNSEFNLRSIGVQVSLPIYSGGSVVASVDQSVANLARAELDLENEINTQMVEIRRQYLAVKWHPATWPSKGPARDCEPASGPTSTCSMLSARCSSRGAIWRRRATSTCWRCCGSNRRPVSRSTRRWPRSTKCL